mgnify:CR=1 FL=1
MGLTALIESGMEATAATELLLNVVWTIVGAILVYFMQAGFAMCEAGFTWTLSWEVFSSLYSGLQSCMEVTGTESSVQPAS